MVIAMKVWQYEAALSAKGCQPFVKTDGTKPRMAAGCERSVVQFRAEIARVNIGDDLARVFGCGQVFPAKFVEAQPLRACEFDSAIDGAGDSRTICPFEEVSTMPPTNSKNWVARRMV
jgi:hypothetical protein